MAQCPFCAATLNDGEILRGKLLTCPQCGKSLSLFSADTKPAPREIAKGVTAQTIPNPAPERPVKPPQRVTIPIDVEEDDEPLSVYQQITNLDTPTLLAFFLSSFALGLGSLSFFGLISKILAGAGLLIGLVLCLSISWKKPWQLGFRIFILLLCSADLLWVGSWPSLPRFSPMPPEALPLNAHAVEGPKAIGDDDWLDALAYARRDRGLRVQVVNVRLANAESLGQTKPAQLTGTILVIKVRVNHDGHPDPLVPYMSWTGSLEAPSKNPPTLTDDQNRRYPLLILDSSKMIVVRNEENTTNAIDPKFGPPILAKVPASTPNIVEARDLTPGKIIAETMYFTVPQGDLRDLKLELPASAFGMEGRYRFQIPKAMIQDS